MKQIQKINFSKKERPAFFAADDPRLGRRRVLQCVMLLRCWNPTTEKLTHNPPKTGVYIGPDGEPVLDEQGKEIPLQVAAHLHNPLFCKEEGSEQGQVFNLHAYLEDEAIIGQPGDFVAVEVLVEEVPKLWKIFEPAIKLIDNCFNGTDNSPELKVLEQVLAQVNHFLLDLPRLLRPADQAQMKALFSDPMDKATEAFAQSSEGLAVEALKAFRESLEQIQFSARVYPVSLYPVTRGLFLEELRAGRVFTLTVRPGDSRKSGDVWAVVQENRVRQSAATLAAQAFAPTELENMLEQLFVQGDILRTEMLHLKQQFCQPVSMASSGS